MRILLQNTVQQTLLGLTKKEIDDTQKKILHTFINKYSNKDILEVLNLNEASNDPITNAGDRLAKWYFEELMLSHFKVAPSYNTILHKIYEEVEKVMQNIKKSFSSQSKIVSKQIIRRATNFLNSIGFPGLMANEKLDYINSEIDKIISTEKSILLLSTGGSLIHFTRLAQNKELKNIYIPAITNKYVQCLNDIAKDLSQCIAELNLAIPQFSNLKTEIGAIVLDTNKPMLKRGADLLNSPSYGAVITYIPEYLFQDFSKRNTLPIIRINNETEIVFLLKNDIQDGPKSLIHYIYEEQTNKNNKAPFSSKQAIKSLHKKIKKDLTKKFKENEDLQILDEICWPESCLLSEVTGFVRKAHSDKYLDCRSHNAQRRAAEREASFFSEHLYRLGAW